jgi:hypothetical protein
MREYLLVNYEEELIVDVLGEQLSEFLFPLRVVCLPHLALVVLNQVHDVIPDVDRRMNEGALLMKSIVVAIHQIGLIQTEDLEAVGQHFLVTNLGGLVENLVKFDIIGELREVNLLVHQQSLIK